MRVHVTGWAEDFAAAFVDGVRVTVRATPTHDRWRCQTHGDRTGRGHCEHTQALGDAPADPSKYRPNGARA